MDLLDVNNECYFIPGSQISYKLISTARTLTGPCVTVTEPGIGDSLQSGNINSGTDASTKAVRWFLTPQGQGWVPVSSLSRV